MKETVVIDGVVGRKPRMGAWLLRSLFCGSSFFADPSQHSETTTTTLFESPPPPYSEKNEEHIFTSQPTSLQHTESDESAYEYIKRYIRDTLTRSTSEQQPDRSLSMYEMRSDADANGGGDLANMRENYQKLMCQLSMSNSSLLRENESFRSRFQYMQTLLQDHVDHLHNVYYTLYLNGFSSIQFPDGEVVNLADFRGIELGLSPREVITSAQLNRVVEEFSELASQLLQSKENGENRLKGGHVPTKEEKEELRLAMLKCITKSKYDDVDDYVKWLNDESSISSGHSHRNCPYSQQSDTDAAQRSDGSTAKEIEAGLQQKTTLDSDITKRCNNEARTATCHPSSSEQNSHVQQHPSPKHRTSRYRTLSAGCSRPTNAFLSAHQGGHQTSNATNSRRSLASLRSMRSSNAQSPARNLI